MVSAVAIPHWPDQFDAIVVAGYVLLILAIPAAGYLCMALDFRAYLRSLKRALVVARGYFYETPEWARDQTPPSIAALGLTLPCSAEEVLSAYRAKVKEMHPDRGGERSAFLKLQQQFEEALRLVE